MTASHHCRMSSFVKGTSFSSEVTHLHTRVLKKTRASARARVNTRTHTYRTVKNVVLATQHEQSFTPVHSSPRVTLRSFEGTEGRGCRSERERGFAADGSGGERGEERAATKKTERQRNGVKGKREARPVCWGGTFTGHLEFAAPSTASMALEAPLPARPRFRPVVVPRSTVALWSRVTPPRGSNRPPSRGKLV